MSELRYKVLRGKYSPIPQYYSTDLSNMVHWLLDPNPESRPTVDSILASEAVIKRLGLLPEVLQNPPPTSGSMLQTIQVPRNLKLLQGRLPAPFYPDDPGIELSQGGALSAPDRGSWGRGGEAAGPAAKLPPPLNQPGLTSVSDPVVPGQRDSSRSSIKSSDSISSRPKPVGGTPGRPAPSNISSNNIYKVGLFAPLSSAPYPPPTPGYGLTPSSSWVHPMHRSTRCPWPPGGPPWTTLPPANPRGCSARSPPPRGTRKRPHLPASPSSTAAGQANSTGGAMGGACPASRRALGRRGPRARHRADCPTSRACGRSSRTTSTVATSGGGSMHPQPPPYMDR